MTAEKRPENWALSDNFGEFNVFPIQHKTHRFIGGLFLLQM
jgi:hypothetical protein